MCLIKGHIEVSGIKHRVTQKSPTYLSFSTEKKTTFSMATILLVKVFDSCINTGCPKKKWALRKMPASKLKPDLLTRFFGFRISI